MNHRHISGTRSMPPTKPSDWKIYAYCYNRPA
jgi:hypothetical protein